MSSPPATAPERDRATWAAGRPPTRPTPPAKLPSVLDVLTVADIMRPVLVWALADFTVSEARTLMRDARVRQLPVLESGLLVGIVAHRDLMGVPDESAPIRTVMRQPVFVLHPRMPAPVAGRIFRERGFGAMPVLEGRELVGIVSLIDITRAVERGAPAEERSR